MLAYSDDAKRLLSAFLEYRNDVDIYTEDDDRNKEFYRVLFSRLVSPKIKINDVYPLGCKNTVIERCKSEPVGNRKKIFIIDGDIALINGNIISHCNLFVLDRYCIENYLIDEMSICNYIYMHSGTKSREEIIGDIQYDRWLNEYSNSLVNLFIHFAISDHFGAKYRLFNANKYHTKIGENIVFDKDLVARDIEEIRCFIIKTYGEDNYNNKYCELSNMWPSTVTNLIKIVSGKDYLIPILLIKAMTFKSSKMHPHIEEVKIHLVHDFDISCLYKLKELIES
jgi:hypothetical protein